MGKTTTAVNLAACLSIAEKKVLLIDLDPSGSASSYLGFSEDSIEGDIFSVLSFTKRIENVIYKTKLDNFDFIPIAVQNMNEERMTLLTKNYHLFKNLFSLTLGEYDYIILDCPPYLKGISTLALAGSDSVIAPLRAGQFSISALQKLLTYIIWVRKNINPKLTLEGILLTMYEPRTKAWRITYQYLSEHFSQYLLKSVIPRSTAITESEFYHKPVIMYNVNSNGSMAYLQLTQELLDRGAKDAGQSHV